jgi:hypothetical protein
VIIGAIVLRVSGEGPRNGMPFGLAYSFDILLPIIKLRDRHYQIDLKTWARYYFYGHKIMGFVLASFLIAGLSGLTKWQNLATAHGEVVGKATRPNELSPNVRFGSRPCENSNTEVARGIFTSISSLQKPIALIGASGRRQLRKQF